MLLKTRLYRDAFLNFIGSQYFRYSKAEAFNVKILIN